MVKKQKPRKMPKTTKKPARKAPLRAAARVPEAATTGVLDGSMKSVFRSAFLRGGH